MTYVRDSVNWYERGALFQAAKNADEAELAAMQLGVVPLETGIRDDVMADEHHADIAEHNYVWSDEEIALDHVTGPLVSEVDRRSALMGGFYPFFRVGSALHYRESETLIYEFCLTTSVQKNLSKRPYNELPVFFELIAAEAARCYLGDGANSMRTGWPSHDHEQRPPNLRVMLEKLGALCGEFKWNPSIDLVEDGHPHAPKDEGMDFVAWKPIDMRQGQVFLLGQCACGDDWTEKLADLDSKRLQRWLNPVTYVDFVKAFAVPHHIPGHAVFSDVCSRAGVTFDRVRLAIVAENNSALFLDKFPRTKVDALIETVAVRYSS